MVKADEDALAALLASAALAWVAALLVSALSSPFIVAMAEERGTGGLSGLGPFVIASGLAGILGRGLEYRHVRPAPGNRRNQQRSSRNSARARHCCSWPHWGRPELWRPVSSPRSARKAR
ncbi:hypothetical protein [Arthrobacter sp. VKM Ac-2550]|uniref:hypothetical protein n=1 Tax=Crystallibacter permensis TaxID=1938888 RepID=UPI0022275D65|nr:hypothetical protein [Arthrobacter sp. VKM Ac-2550]